MGIYMYIYNFDNICDMHGMHKWDAESEMGGMGRSFDGAIQITSSCPISFPEYACSRVR